MTVAVCLLIAGMMVGAGAMLEEGRVVRRGRGTGGGGVEEVRKYSAVRTTASSKSAAGIARVVLVVGGAVLAFGWEW